MFIQRKAKLAQMHHKRFNQSEAGILLLHQPKYWTICCQMKTWQVFPKTDKEGFEKHSTNMRPAFKWLPRGFNTHSVDIFFPSWNNISNLLAYDVN